MIDFDTKEPIEGAVMVVYWMERMAHPAGGDTRLKEVKETLTDKNGKWSITGPKEESGDPYYSFVTKTYYIQHPRFIVFKPGYCSWPEGFALDACRGKMKPGGSGKVAQGEDVELPGLEKKEDRIRAKPSPVGERADWKKQKHLIRLIRDEWRFLYGKNPTGLYEEEENQDEK